MSRHKFEAILAKLIRRVKGDQCGICYNVYRMFGLRGEFLDDLLVVSCLVICLCMRNAAYTHTQCDTYAFVSYMLCVCVFVFIYTCIGYMSHMSYALHT